MEKLNMRTGDIANENFRKLAEMFPEAVTETTDEHGEVVRAIDKDVLMQAISTYVVEGNDERYQFTWPDKRKAIRLSSVPVAATLRPCREESVNFDTTENLYIEGDNLDVLKVLRETYLGKVKMIYIDPPYNTGNDFVYEDDFSRDTGDYIANSGQFDDIGNRLVENKESNGRFHTDWLNMIYPRLKVAKDLLSDDGVIFISIDDHEVANLRKICDEIFGEENLIASMIWQQGKKSSGNLIGINHEYMLAYAKNRSLIDRVDTPFQQKKLGLDKIYAKYNALKRQYGQDYKKIEVGMKEFYNSLPENDPAYNHRLYCLVDKNGLFQSDNAAAPDKPATRSHRPLVHPISQKPTAVPAMGWRFTDKTLDELVAKDYILFGDDETKIPRVKRYLKEYEYEIPSTVFYKPGAAASFELQKLLDKRLFDNPKNRVEIQRIIGFVTYFNNEAIIMDFFSGSATTAHAVMQLNAEDGGNRKFIMVQLPEICDEKSEAAKADYKNICEIGKERIRRAGRKILEELAQKQAEKADDLLAGTEPAPSLDTGFRVLKLDSTNMKEVYYNPAATLQEDLLGRVDNIKEDRTPEDLLFQVMLELGILPSSKIEQSTIAGKQVFNVADNFLLACFEDDVTDEVVTAIAKLKPVYAVLRDRSFASDSVVANFEQIFAAYSPDTTRKIL